MNTPAISSLPASEQILVDEEHPWPGLASFREQDEHYFKGRRHDIEKLRTLVDRERLTVLFGVSGLGKSSLLQAGLFPRLRQENTFRYISAWILRLRRCLSVSRYSWPLPSKRRLM